MKREGYGADYAYDHDAPDAFSGQNYWPEALGRRALYEPVERGFEREIRKRLDYWARLRSRAGARVTGSSHPFTPPADQPPGRGA